MKYRRKLRYSRKNVFKWRKMLVILLLVIIKFEIFKYYFFPSNNKPVDSDFINALADQYFATYSKRYESGNFKCSSNTSKNNTEDQSVLKTIGDRLESSSKVIIPFPSKHFSGRGIVFTIGSPQIKYAKVNLKMIEVSSSKLPVEIWYSERHLNKSQVKELLGVSSKIKLTICCFESAKCQNRDGERKIDSKFIYKPHLTFQLDNILLYRAASILSSSFQEVLFLNHDAYLVRDPEHLFSADPIYRKFGVLLYPDTRISHQQAILWSYLKLDCIQDEYNIDTSTILINKERLWKGLFLTKLLTDHHHIFNRLSFGDPMDIIRIAFRYVHLKYYLVTVPCSTGHYSGNKFCGYSVCKTDSLTQHIYINHLKLFAGENIEHTKGNLEHTRLGLGDSNSNHFFLQQCQAKDAPAICIHIGTLPMTSADSSGCFNGKIVPTESRDHKYGLKEPLFTTDSRQNHVIISKTNNLMPKFLDNILKFASKYSLDQKSSSDHAKSKH